jgi:hypothetical protein
MKIILAVKTPARKAIFQRAISEYDLDCCVVETLQEVITHAALEEHAGILIDMQLLVRKHIGPVAELDDVLNSMPSAILNIKMPSGAVHILSRGDIASGCVTVDQFIIICRQFVPKKVVYRYRQAFHHNILISRSSEFTNAYKSACLDISTSGCYIFYTLDDICEGDSIWVKFPANVRTSPVKAIVSWIRKWGTSENLPGIGASFSESIEDITL